ncbi:DNRLRE domain-containing protein [Paenibacillus sp. FSL H7-0331]|uniref:CBM96 family carbohydrate-binding protein n=1 Tax=Paenibacillus sp. FSL H7-0331 TaxID=1920421 RepID=UPI00096E9A18|nr:DNRLRE domain-containing protein [Paenibacillus sp. FSL H7-0331]OMF10959.1 hypothetical protein BK127_25635 [Paenibacillus sp. FSL H7-0331]
MLKRRWVGWLGLVLAAVLLGILWTGGTNVVSASPNDYYVSVSGNDTTGDGSLENPWRTIQKAADVMTAGDTCFIRGGVYRETVVPAASGSSSTMMTFKSYNNEIVTISGSEPVTGWTADSAGPTGIFKASIAGSLGSGNQIFLNGTMIPEARWPNNTGTLMEPTLAVADNGTNTTITDSDIPAGVNWAGATVWFAGGAAWAGQDSTVTAFDPISHIITFNSVKAASTNYDARSGNTFYLSGIKAALDSQNEWWYDEASQQLFLWPPGGNDPSGAAVEMKKRLYGFDLSGRSYIAIEGIRLFATSLKTDDGTHHVRIGQMKAEYISHNTRNKTAKGEGRPDEDNNGITIRGSYNEISGSEFAYSSGSLLNLTGNQHQVVNNYFHDGNYAGTWNGLISTLGEQHYIGYNTLARGGRDGIKLAQPRGLIVEHNDISNGGMLTKDSGLLYTAGSHSMGTEIRYNKFHDMYTHLGMGIYTDNQSSHFLIHHNVIWNVPNSDPIRLNSPSNYNLVYNNTAGTGTSDMFTWAAVFRDDMFGDRVYNNIVPGGISFPGSKGVATGNNIVTGLDLKFADPVHFDFRLQAESPAVDMGTVIAGITDGYTGAAPDIGAYEYGQSDFKSGHDFANPPSAINLTRTVPPYANLIINGGFESSEQLQSWNTTAGIVQAVYAPGAAWSSQTAAVRTQNGSVLLKGQQAELKQTVSGLQPDTRYTLSLWAKTTDAAVPAVFGVRSYGSSTVTRYVYETGWTQTVFDFTTGPSATTADVFIGKADGRGTGAGGSLYELDTQTSAGTGSSVLEYDVSAFIRSEAAGDQTASLNMKGSYSRTTFSIRRSGTVQPRLIVTTADSPVPVEITASGSAGVRTRSGTTNGDMNYANPTSFNAANWNSGYQEEIFLKFPLTVLAGKEIISAKLKMTAAGAAAAGAKSTLYGLSDDSWSETALTWNNKPQAFERIVYFDDIGLILPLDRHSEGDVLRDVILQARGIYDNAVASDEYAEGVLEDFALAVDAAVGVAANPASSGSDMTNARMALQAELDIFSARSGMLVELVRVRQAVGAAVEGTLPGQYETGAKTAFQTVLTASQIAFDDPLTGKSGLDAAKAALIAAAVLMEERVVTTAVPLLPKADVGGMLSSTSGWSDSYVYNSNGSVFSRDVTKYSAQKFGSSVFAFDLKYTFLNNGGEWPGITLRAQTPNKLINNGDTTYFIVFKPGTWELQKWVNGSQTQFREFANTQFDGNKTQVYVGAINVEGGVRLLCYAGAQKVFDVIDRDNPIVQDGYFGILSAGQSGNVTVKADPMPEALLAGPNKSTVGDSVSLKLHLYGVTQSVYGSVYGSVGGSVYGIHAGLQFDSTVFDFAGAVPLLADQTVSVQNHNGTLVLDYPLPSGAAIRSDEPVLELKFVPKLIRSSAMISLNSVSITDSGGSTVQAFPFSKRLETE